jgi:hypothetical protein
MYHQNEYIDFLKISYALHILYECMYVYLCMYVCYVYMDT